MIDEGPFREILFAGFHMSPASIQCGVTVFFHVYMISEPCPVRTTETVV